MIGQHVHFQSLTLIVHNILVPATVAMDYTGISASRLAIIIRIVFRFDFPAE